MLMLVTASCAIFDGDRDDQPGEGDPVVPLVAEFPDRPVVEAMPPRVVGVPPLDPQADPRTPLGELRARYLPVWTPDLDWAFPPETCGTAWELDGIAVAVSDAEISRYGDPTTMSALAVMRYEHLLSQALANPSPLSQLCVAVATVEPARANALGVLADAIADSTHEVSQPRYPLEVTLVALSPSSALALACIDKAAASPSPASAPQESVAASAQLGAYLLRTSRGIEDNVPDISFRVSHARTRTEDSCAGFGSWVAEWSSHVEQWLAEGQIWTWRLDSVTQAAICDQPPDGSPVECPLNWPR